MKVTYNRSIEYSEAGPDFKLRLGSMFRFFQEAAITHSRQAGFAPEALHVNGFSWILNKIAVSIDSLPQYNEALTIKTWSKKINSFKAYRDFELYSNGKRSVSATSIWLFFDLEAKKLRPIPAEVEERYSVENSDANSLNLDQWRLPRSFPCENQSEIKLRFSDFDSNNHVNNAVYIDYMEDHFSKFYRQSPIKTLMFQFNKEIQPNAAGINIASGQNEENRIQLKIVDENTHFGTAEILV